MQRPNANDILQHLQGQRQEMIRLLESMVRVESPSDEPGTQHEIREIIATELEQLGFRICRIPGRNSGGMLYASYPSRDKGAKAQLMLGHYDTVWPLGTLGHMPFEVDGDIIRGPGVYDMKGGIAQALLALKTLRHFGIEPTVSPAIFLNSDEEIGSRESGRYIAALAAHMERVFVLEPSLGVDGLLKTARKGIGRFTVTVTGEAAHAGLNPGAGASAILELSHVIQTLFALNDFDKGITVNVGTIDGGLRPNVVAPNSQAAVDVRVPTQVEAEAITASILGIDTTIPGTSLIIEGHFGRQPMERTPANRQLWKLANQLGSELGLELEQGLAGGGSDGNTTSLYAATLDGMGPVGDGAHARHEYLLIGKTLERAALLSMLLIADKIE
ncbi:MAG: M20 family metallopeptidase [Gammaproteobacteria bacterium]|nr:M20 family metallopeptidase [Gammaproteobacteria bacterium]